MSLYCVDGMDVSSGVVDREQCLQYFPRGSIVAYRQYLVLNINSLIALSLTCNLIRMRLFFIQGVDTPLHNAPIIQKKRHKNNKTYITTLFFKKKKNK